MAPLLKKEDAQGSPKRGGVNEDGLVRLTLNDTGMIRDCNQACRQLLGCVSSKLVWKHVSTLLPQLAHIALKSDGKINPRLSFLSRIGHPFEVVSPTGSHFQSRLFFNEIGNAGRQQLCVILRPIETASCLKKSARPP